MKKILFFALLLSSFNLSNATNIVTGLHFKSHFYKAGDRTALSLENGEPILLKKQTELTFDMLVRPENFVFGFVFRVITDKNENIDLVFSPTGKIGSAPNLVINEISYPLNGTIDFDNWLPVRLNMSKAENNITLSYGGKTITIPHSLKDTKSFLVQFGVCLINKFTTNDPAPVNIKDIRILQNNDLDRYWKLDKYNGNKCYDEMKQSPALVSNPHWLIDDHTRWKEIYTTQTTVSPQLSFDRKKGLIYIIENSKKIKIFNVNTFKETTVPVQKGFIAGEKVSQLVMDSLQNRLVSYNLAEKRLSFFDGENSTWSNPTPAKMEPSYWHQTSAFYPRDTSIITFGGYGYYKYNNTLFHINLKNGVFTEKTISGIYPRYTPASTIVGNQLYIFGGRGSRNGSQELSPHNFYDLYSIDLTTYKAKKLWDNRGTLMSFIPASNMIYIPSEKCFYVFTNEAGGRLAKISPTDSTIEFVGKNLSQKLDVDYLYMTLYYSPQLSKFFAIMTLQNNNGGRVKIFSMDYPPLCESDTIQILEEKSNMPYYILLCCAALMLTAFYFSRRKKKPAREQKNTALQQTANSYDDGSRLPSYFDRSKSSISLLGSFSVRNQAGKDITDKFSPTLKSLLILLIISTENETNGITGEKINRTLWSDKYKDSARNNRNVSIRKLRILLEEVGDLEIRSNNYWGMSYGNTVFCDYHLVMEFIRTLKNDILYDEENFNKLIELILYGPLLPDMTLDWLDNYKSDLSNLVLDFLKDLSGKISEDDIQNRIRIADAILSHDTLNEEAIRIKCRALFYSEKKGLAKNAYDNFCKEYLALIGERFNRSFSEFIENKYKID